MGTNDTMGQGETTISERRSYFESTFESRTQPAVYQTSAGGEDGDWSPVLVSDAAFSTVMPVLNALSMALGCLSIVCCAANSLVYFKQRSNPSAYYLLALNIGDGLHSACKMAYAFTAAMLPSTHKIYFIMAFNVSAGAGTCFRRTAVCMNALTSLDRFLAIAFPLRGRTQGNCGRRAPLFVITALFCIVVLIHSYLFYEYELTPTEDYAWVPRFTPMRLHNPEAFMWARYLGRGLCFYLPLVASLGFNVALLCVLRAHDKLTRSMRRTAGGPAQPARPSGGERHSHTAQLATGHAVPDVSCADDRNDDHRETTPTFSPSSTFQDTSPRQHAHGDESLTKNTHTETQQYQHGDPGRQSPRQTCHHGTEQHTQDRHAGHTVSERAPGPEQRRKGRTKRGATDRAESDRTRLILTLTFAFFFLALPRLVVAEAYRLFSEFLFRQRNLNVVLVVVSDCLAFSTDAVISFVTLFYSAHFRTIIRRVVLKKSATSTPAARNAATANTV